MYFPIVHPGTRFAIKKLAWQVIFFQKNTHSESPRQELNWE